MSKFKIVNLFDKLFVTIAIFLFCFAWINFYIHSLWTTFVLSLILTFAIVFILYYFLSKKNKKKTASASQFKETNKYFYIFRLLPKTERLKILKSVLEKKYPVQLKNGILTYTKDDKIHLVLIATQYEIISQNEIFCLLDELLDIKVDFIDIICNEYKNFATNIFNDKQIRFIDKFDLYKAFKETNIFPYSANINVAVPKIKFKDILRAIFTPNKARSYFLCGLVLIFSSIILPYHVYYVVVGSMLMMFSIICKILPLFDKN